MNSQINILSDDALDFVAGGMMNIQKGGTSHTTQGGGGGSYIPAANNNEQDGIAAAGLFLLGVLTVLSL